MDTPALDARIQRADMALVKARERAESSAKNVLAQACSFVRDWIERAVAHEITEKPEISKSLGLEGLGKLKQDLADLCSRLPTLVDQDLGADTLWPHRSDEIDRNWSYLISGERPVDGLDEAIRSLMGYAGELLQKHGFKEVEGTSWEKRGGRWRYRYAYQMPAPLKQALEGYGEIFKQVQRAANECQMARRAKEQAEASDLWNRA